MIFKGLLQIIMPLMFWIFFMFNRDFLIQIYIGLLGLDILNFWRNNQYMGTADVIVSVGFMICLVYLIYNEWMRRKNYKKPE